MMMICHNITNYASRNDTGTTLVSMLVRGKETICKPPWYTADGSAHMNLENSRPAEYTTFSCSRSADYTYTQNPP